MSKTLCIDWGNTHVKAAVVNGENRVSDVQQSPSEDGISFLNALITIHRPQKAVLCSVGNNTSEAEHILEEKMESFLKVDSNTTLPIINAYSSPESLGTDRLALAVGAHEAYPGKNVLVVSLGTCITYNFVQRNGTFRGGAISPGLQMRLRAMSEFTHSLPQVAAEGELVLLGYDTPTCMRSGAIYGMASEIDGMVASFASQYADFNAVLTGGDAPLFANKLKSRIFVDPNIAFRGLNLIFKHNVPQLQ